MRFIITMDVTDLLGNQVPISDNTEYIVAIESRPTR